MEDDPIVISSDDDDVPQEQVVAYDPDTCMSSPDGVFDGLHDRVSASVVHQDAQWGVFYCGQHMFTIKQSEALAGLSPPLVEPGLYVAPGRTLRANTILGVYFGRVLGPTERGANGGAFEYEPRKNHRLDGKNSTSGMQFMNSDRNTGRVRKAVWGYNSAVVRVRKHHTIQNGEEILINYTPHEPIGDPIGGAAAAAAAADVDVYHGATAGPDGDGMPPATALLARPNDWSICRLDVPVTAAFVDLCL